MITLMTLGVATGTAAKASTSNSLTVLVGTAYTWSAGLDPTDPESASGAIFHDAIYGDLFLLNASGKIVPDLTSGYKEVDGGKIWDIYIRTGVRFQDGSPFTAQAVAFNIKRDLVPSVACICDANFPVSSITTPNSHTVVIKLTRRFAPFIAGFIDEPPNWIVSPTALSKMGPNAFKVKPVGAGPFEVVSNTPDSKLVLKANPTYWHKGQPKVNSLTFLTVGTDQSAYEAMVTGEAQAYNALGTLSMIPTISKKFKVTASSTNEPAIVQLNTTIAPFNNINARRAIYYATDTKALMKGIFGTTKYADESLEGPGGKFYERTVPGYPTYNLAKAKALVKSLGGLKITFSVGNTLPQEQVGEALKSQWSQAGIQTTLSAVDLPTLVQQYRSNSWEVANAQSGGFDPALIPGLAFRFASNATFTGVHDPTLDKLMATAAATSNATARTKDYDEIYSYVAQHAYAPVLYAAPSNFTVTVKGLSGLGLTTSNTPNYDWATVSFNNN